MNKAFNSGLACSFRSKAMTIRAGSMAAGRQGTGAAARSLHPDPKAGGSKTRLDLVLTFETFKHTPRDITL